MKPTTERQKESKGEGTAPPKRLRNQRSARKSKKSELTEALSGAINSINLIIHSTLQFDEIMQRVVSEAASAIGCESAAISLRKDGHWIVSYVHNLPQDIVGSQMNDEEELHAVLAIKNKEPVAINDAPIDSRVNQEHMIKWNIRSVLTVPLITKEDVIGVLFFNYHKSATAFTAYHIDFAAKLSASLALAIENARLFETLQQERAALREINKTLEQKVLERTKELEEAYSTLQSYASRLEDLNRELQEFSFVSSHDLMEPLRKIQAFGNILKMTSGSLLPDEGKDYLSRMGGAANRMQELLQTLLGYSRIATQAKSFQSTDLAKVVRETVSDMVVTLMETDARVEIGDLPTIEADPVQMRQLFQNLIGNSIKYQRRGEKPVVKVYGRTDKDECQVFVEDSGIGFKEKYVNRIFQPFQRLHGKSSGYEGMGMGLAICKKIVERHRGKITAKSTPSVGSTFIITLPVKQPKGE